MPFIGQEPITGAYHVLDAITASATATYNLQLNSGAFSPATANQLLVSLNGVIQKPGSSFTISGSQITFSSALTSSDSIDFIIALGDVLSVGTPTDGTVSTAKIITGAVTMDKLPSALSFTGKTISNLTLPVETDYETLVVNVKAGTSTSIAVSTWTHAAGFNTEIIDNRNAWDGAGTFTVPAGMGGVYMAAFTSEFWFNSAGNDPTSIAQMWYVNGAQSYNYNRAYYNGSGNTAISGLSPLLLGIHNLSAGDTLKPYCWQQNSGNQGASIENGNQTQVYIQRISGNT
jgi:hypothetical protein